MIILKEWAPQAIEKLEKGKKDVKGQKETAMASAVLAALKDFSAQDEEFARAVVQGGNFADCMKAVAKGVGNSISDIDAYRKAVQFYFPGAKVKMQLSIDLIGDAAGNNPNEKAPTGGGLILNLEDFI